MNKKIVIELDKRLNEDEILIYKDGKVKSVEIHELLPEIIDIKQDIVDIKQNIAVIRKTISDLAKLIKEK